MPRDKLLGSLTLWHGWISALKIIVSRYLSELFLEHWGHITKDMAVCDTVCGYTWTMRISRLNTQVWIC